MKYHPMPSFEKAFIFKYPGWKFSCFRVNWKNSIHHYITFQWKTSFHWTTNVFRMLNWGRIVIFKVLDYILYIYKFERTLRTFSLIRKFLKVKNIATYLIFPLLAVQTSWYPLSFKKGIKMNWNSWVRWRVNT